MGALPTSRLRYSRSASTAAASGCASTPALPGPVVAAGTRWPGATCRGPSRRPMTPVPPATNARVPVPSLILDLILSQVTRPPGRL
jgi:hypothetical protein